MNHQKEIEELEGLKNYYLTICDDPSEYEDQAQRFRGIAHDALKTCHRLIKNFAWIPCSERLPEKSDYYWVTMENRRNEFITMKWFYQLGLGFSQIEGKVIAWMPLPQPFKS